MVKAEAWEEQNASLGNVPILQPQTESGKSHRHHLTNDGKSLSTVKQGCSWAGDQTLAPCSQGPGGAVWTSTPPQDLGLQRVWWPTGLLFYKIQGYWAPSVTLERVNCLMTSLPQLLEPVREKLNFSELKDDIKSCSMIKWRQQDMVLCLVWKK